MLIDPKTLRRVFDVRPSGVLHVGGHLAEEFEAYQEQSFGRVIWVEAQENLARQIENKVLHAQHLVLEGVAWSRSGLKKNFNFANNGQSSSVYDLGTHSESYPGIKYTSTKIMTTVRLDELVPAREKFDFLNLDIQGAELEALRGLGSRLDEVNWVYSEVNREAVYEGIPMVAEIDRFLRGAGFWRVCTVWTDAGWGDALYIRRRGGFYDFAHRLAGARFLGPLKMQRLLKVFANSVRRYLADPIYVRVKRIPRVR